MRNVLTDIRFAFRQLLRRPGWTSLVLLVFGLSVGAATATFAVVDAVLFRPIAVQQPERLVRAFPASDTGELWGNLSYPGFKDVHDGMHSFDGVAAYTSWLSLHVAQEGQAPRRIAGGIASGEFFRVLGAAPFRGRLLGPHDDAQPGASPVAVLGYRHWRDAYQSDEGIVGREILVNGHRFTIVGVTQPGFHGADEYGDVDMWVPMSMMRQTMPDWAADDPTTMRGFSWLDVVARLAPGVTMTQAQEEATALALNRRKVLGNDPDGADQSEREPMLTLLSAQDAAFDAYSTEGKRSLAWLLVGAVGLIVLIGCGNVMGLLLVRREERRGELAVRLGVGARPGRLVQQLMIEGAVLALAGAALGLVFAQGLVTLLAAVAPPGFALPLGLADEIAAPRVIVAALALAGVATLLSSTLPAIGAGRMAIAAAARGQGQAVLGGARQRGRAGIVAMQIALSLVLLSCAGLLIRSLVGLTAVQPGFATADAATASMNLALQGYDAPRRATFVQQLLERLRATPGVAGAAVAQGVPVNPNGMRTSFDVEGYAAPEGEPFNAEFLPVTPGFFAALEIPLLRGRDVEARDTKETAQVVVVSRALAERFWPGQDALGKRFKLGRDEVTIVGVAGDIALRSLRERTPWVVYRPWGQFSTSALAVVVRMAPGLGGSALDALRDNVRALDPQLPVYADRTLEQQIARNNADARLVAGTLALFGGIALALSLAGTYGLFAYLVRARRREIGLRMALGADARGVLALFLRRGATLVGIGILAGLAGGTAAAQLLETQLFGIGTLDVTTYLLASVFVAAVATLAILVPAHQATRIDPQTALRAE